MLPCSLILIFTAVGCGGQKEQAGPEQAGPVVLRLAEATGASQLIPATQGSRQRQVNYIFDKLIERTKMGFIPWLAGLGNLDGGKKYVFQLVENAQWRWRTLYRRGRGLYFEYIKKYRR